MTGKQPALTLFSFLIAAGCCCNIGLAFVARNGRPLRVLPSPIRKDPFWGLEQQQQQPPWRTVFPVKSSNIRLSAKGSEQNREPLLDVVLSRLTSAFPFFVLSSALIALKQPALLTWVNEGNLISWMLASVMWGTGLTLQKKDFTNVLKDNWFDVPLGVLCQFIIMPLSAWAVGRALLMTKGTEAASSLFLGLCLVGCSPGGTASNLVALIAKADVALSVILTACSTLLAVVMTPLLVKLLVGSEITVSGIALCEATARVVLLPVLGGMLLNAKVPKLAQALSRFAPFASVLMVSVICGGVVAQNTALLLSGGQGLILRAVLLLHTLGFLAGYWIPKKVFSRDERTSRTVSIEVGMQNSALAVVLARSIGAPPLACLPGALSATAHSCIGSLLAAYWRTKDDRDQQKFDYSI